MEICDGEVEVTIKKWAKQFRYKVESFLMKHKVEKPDSFWESNIKYVAIARTLDKSRFGRGVIVGVLFLRELNHIIDEFCQSFVIPHMRGMGIATVMNDMLMGIVRKPFVVCTIKGNNEASIKVVEKVGFKMAELGENPMTQNQVDLYTKAMKIRVT